MEVEWHLFCIFKIFNVLNFKILGELRDLLHNPSFEKEGVLGLEVIWLNQKVSQSSLEPFVLLNVGTVDVCAMCWWEILDVCSLCMRDLTHTYSCTCLFNQRKTKKETNTSSTGLSMREPKSFYYYYYYYYYFILFYMFTQLFII